MSKNQKSGGNMLGRIFLGSGIMVLMVGAPVFLQPAWAANAGYLRIIIEGAQRPLDGSSKDAAHMNWVEVSSVVAADLNGDAMADREASSAAGSGAASHAIASPRDAQSGMATGKSVAPSPASSSSVQTAREASTGMATGKRMHKPFTITKEIDKASPLLAQACASGQHLAEVDVDLASGGKYKLTDVMVSSDRKAGGTDHPMETISFTYQKIEMK